jgi:hypothetical protein
MAGGRRRGSPRRQRWKRMSRATRQVADAAVGSQKKPPAGVFVSMWRLWAGLVCSTLARLLVQDLANKVIEGRARQPPSPDHQPFHVATTKRTEERCRARLDAGGACGLRCQALGEGPHALLWAAERAAPCPRGRSYSGRRSGNGQLPSGGRAAHLRVGNQEFRSIVFHARTTKGNGAHAESNGRT